MGWLIERAKERQSKLTAPGTIAARAWKPKLVGALSSREALANRLRTLDRGKGLEWWGSTEGKPYTEAVAAVLKATPTEFLAWIDAARPARDDDARWFRFEVFPRLRPLDLDVEDPYPGVPATLWRGDGPRGPTWWHAPPGAGRTLVGRWLARRHGWSLATSTTDVVERVFLEHDAPDLPVLRQPGRLVVASPHPMPESLGASGWEEVRGEPGWERALLTWAQDRLLPGGHFDARLAVTALKAGRLSASTPGALLEGLAELDALGVEVLSDQAPAARALDAWVRAHAGRADRSVRPASRDWLREHGAWLLPRVELERLHRGLDVTPQHVVACMPALPAASPDAIREARDAGDVDAALTLLRPEPADLVAAMSGLRWLLPADWGLPSRVRRQVSCRAIELALDEGEDLTVVGALLNRQEIADDVVRALAQPPRLAAWIERLAAGDAEAHLTALVADGLLKAFALLAAEPAVPVDGIARDLAAALQRAYGQPCPDLAVASRVEDAEVWSSIGWLTLLRLRAVPDPGPDRTSVWAWHAGQALDWRSEPPNPTRRRLRGLAADTLGSLVHADPGWRWTPPAVAALAALTRTGSVDRSSASELGQLRALEVIERLAAPWAPSIEAVCHLLWPVWMAWGIPEEDSAERLASVWATFPHDQVEGRLSTQLVDHAARGVPLPARLWPLAITAAPGQREVLDRAPLDALLDCAKGLEAWIAPVAWARAPERALGVIAKCVGGEVGHNMAPWFAAIPPECALDVLKVLGESASPSGRRAARQWWADRAIRERVPGWEKVWDWVRAEAR